MNIRNEEEEVSQPFKENYYYTCEMFNSAKDYDSLYFKDKGDYYAFAILGDDDFKIVSEVDGYDGILDAVLSNGKAMAVSLQQNFLKVYKSTHEYKSETVKLKGTTSADLTMQRSFIRSSSTRTSSLQGEKRSTSSTLTTRRSSSGSASTTVILVPF